MKTQQTYEHQGQRFIVFLDRMYAVSFVQIDGSTFHMSSLPLALWRRINYFVNYAADHPKSHPVVEIERFKAVARMWHLHRFADFVRFKPGKWIKTLAFDGQFYYIKANGDNFLLAYEQLPEGEDQLADELTHKQMEELLWGQNGMVYCTRED